MIKYLYFLFFITLVYAQQNTDPAKLLDKGAALFSRGNYGEAEKIFTALISEKNNHVRIPAEIFLGKTYIKLGDYKRGNEIFDRLSGSVRDSVYLREILLNKALLLYREQMYYESAEELLRLLTISGGTEYFSYARSALDTIAVFNVSPDQLEVLYTLSRSEQKPFLLLLMGKSYLASGSREEAKKTFLKIIQQHKSSAERKEAEDYFYERKKITLPSQGDPVIVILLPENSGSVGAALKQIDQGIRYAVHQFNTQREDKIGVISIYFDKDRIREIRSEIQSLNAKCVIGPVYSQDVRDMLAEFRGVKIPLISPTATDNDLTSMNEYFFQANPNFTLRGKAMAQFVYFVENKRKVGILNAIEGYSPLLAADFSREFRRLGGEVVINQTYKSRSAVIDEPVLKIAEKLNEIEALYVPVSEKDDVFPVLSGLAKHNIFIPLYGNQDWFLGKGYEQFPSLKNNLVFTSDYFIDYSSFSYTGFNEEFRNVTGNEAERNVLYGYDITKYFLNQLTKINAGSEVIAQRMMMGNTVTGFHNNICFDEARVNKFINIIRYREGLFELADKFKTGD